MTDLACNEISIKISDSISASERSPFRVPEAVTNAIVDHAGEFHTLIGPDLQPIWMSETVQTVLGYSPREAAALPAGMIIHPEEYKRFTEALHELAGEIGGRRRLRHRVRHADGTWRWTEIIMTNLFDRPGVEAIITTTRDVTTQVATKRRLALCERRLRSIVSSAGDVVVILDSDRNVEFVTPTAAALLKCSTVAVRDNWASLIHKDDVPALGELLRSALGDAGVTKGPVPVRVRRSDGVWLTLEFLVTDYEADPIVRAVVINARDVTSRRLIEVERARNQSMFNALVELAPVGIFLADAAGDWTYANARISEEFGVESIDLLGKGWVELFDAADVLRLRSELIRWDGEGRYVTELRSRIDPDLRGFKVTISRPDSAGIVGTIEDVTHRRELDEMLIDGAAFGSLAEVVGSAAHDIHNLLSSIGLQLGLLDKVEEPERVTAANEAVDRACDITEDLMAISRPTKSRIASVEIGSLVDGLAGMLKVLVEHQADLTVVKDGVGSDQLVAFADRSGLERVITNLVVNALDAVEVRGRITLGVSLVELDANSIPMGDKPGSYVAVSVTDDGCGIPESALERIFDPYFTTKADGNGIGLAASRRNVRAWGGDLVVESVEQKGTTVTVLLPTEHTIG